MARERVSGVYAFSRVAAYDFDPEAQDDGIVFGYSSLSEAQIEDAVRRLRKMLDKGSAPSPSEPFPFTRSTVRPGDDPATS